MPLQEPLTKVRRGVGSLSLGSYPERDDAPGLATDVARFTVRCTSGSPTDHKPSASRLSRFVSVPTTATPFHVAASSSHDAVRASASIR